jgi:hypothetical protein
MPTPALTPIGSDSFNRANENPLNSTNWSDISILGGGLQIISDQCVPTQNSAQLAEFFNTSAPNDQFSQATLAAIQSNSYVSLFCRYQGGSSLAGYELKLRAGSARIQFFEGTSLGSVSDTTHVNDIYALAVVGTTLYAIKNGTSVLSVTDSTYSSGSTGLGLDSVSTVTDTAVINFVMGSASLQQPAPTFSPVPGTYTTAQSVTLTSPGADAIYYTLDGSTPTPSSTLYSGPITVSRTTTINAIAVKSGLATSTVATAVYTITLAFSFNSAFRLTNFPSTGQPGTLWFDTETRDMYVAVADPNEFFPGESDNENVTRIFSEGLTVSTCTRLNVPAVAVAGTIFLTTDTFEAFAGTGFPGPGNGVLAFNLDVYRALRGIGLPQQDHSGRVPIGAPATPVFYVSLGG